MSPIFPETHTIIAKELTQKLNNKYELNLNEARVIWGAISPDFLPKYKIYSHYLDGSLNFVVNEIVGLIYITQRARIPLQGFYRKFISTKIGVISHFLADYTCLAHHKKWRFKDEFRIHVAYEKNLHLSAKQHHFKEIIRTDDLEISDFDRVLLKRIVKDYIINIVNEYSLEQSMERDLDFALDFNYKITQFILDTVSQLSMEGVRLHAFVF